jgi:hypothetical protein
LTAVSSFGVGTAVTTLMAVSRVFLPLFQAP